jgi:hypothetical protein
LYKGQKLYCVDAYTGKELYTMLSWVGQSGGGGTSTSVLAEGFLVYYNYYDGQLYCVGKGPSATTVSAPQTVIPKGTGVLLTGTVTDQSSGAKQLVQDSKFSIVPAVSDASMSAWMEYMYMQKPKPTNATGVSVKLTVYDPNGNAQDVGTTTADLNGKYAIIWTPTLEGTYYVIATFEGSNSYWGSQDTAYFAVGPAPAVAQPSAAPTPTPSPVASPTVQPSATPSTVPTTEPGAGLGTEYYIAIVAVVIIVAIAAVALILRRRK